MTLTQLSVVRKRRLLLRTKREKLRQKPRRKFKKRRTIFLQVMRISFVRLILTSLIQGKKMLKKIFFKALDSKRNSLTKKERNNQSQRKKMKRRMRKPKTSKVRHQLMIEEKDQKFSNLASQIFQAIKSTCQL